MMETSKRVQFISVAAAVIFVVVAMMAGYLNIGLPPVVIVGGSGLIGLVMWYKTYLRHPLEPQIILPVFLLTAAALEIHMAEEYLTHFGPAMSRLFDISWSERSFLIVFAFIGPTLYLLTALGLYYRIPLAGFMAWFIFIGPGVAEFTHFIFPVLKPAIEPEVAGSISQAVSNGAFISDMPNYYIKTTGRYYFSGMYTAVLPMIPGIYAIYKVDTGGEFPKQTTYGIYPTKSKGRRWLKSNSPPVSKLFEPAADLARLPRICLARRWPLAGVSEEVEGW